MQLFFAAIQRDDVHVNKEMTRTTLFVNSNIYM